MSAPVKGSEDQPLAIIESQVIIIFSFLSQTPLQFHLLTPP